MDDLKTRIKTFLDEIEYTHLKRAWPERLVAAGINEREAHKWAAEIGHVVDEYRSTLMQLAELLQVTDTERIPQQVHSWAVGISEVTVPEINEPMLYLKGLLEEYLPPEPDDEEEPS